MSEVEPDTENVVYLDEAREAYWLRTLAAARKAGVAAVFNAEKEEAATVVRFPNGSDTPDDAA